MISCEYPGKEVLKKQIEKLIKKLPQIVTDPTSMFYIGNQLIKIGDTYEEPPEEAAEKAILEIPMPEKCLSCTVAFYETGDAGEHLMCIPLSSIKHEEIEGDYLKRRNDCPLKPKRFIK